MQLVVTGNITLDGVIEAAGEWFSPANAGRTVDVSDIQADSRSR